MATDLAKEKGARGKQQQKQAQPTQSETAEEQQQQPQQQPEEQVSVAAQAEEPAAEEPKKDRKKKDKKKKDKQQQQEEGAPVTEDKPKKAKKAAKEAEKAVKEAKKTAKETKAAVKEEKPAPQQKQQQKVEQPQEQEHVQSERNARRRQHREFLRQVEARKDSDATPAQKSIVIFGLSADVTQKHVLKKVKKVGPVATVELRADDAKVNTNRQIAVVRFEKLKDAQLAVQKLDHHIFKGATLRVQSLEKHEANPGDKSGKSADASKAEGLRLIVRNLAFQTTDEDLTKAFAVHGPLAEVRVVRMPVEATEGEEEGDALKLGKSRGFGFVQFRDLQDARAAVDSQNGVKIKGREMIVDFALSKAKYMQQQQQSEQQTNTESGGDANDEDAEMAGSDEDHDDADAEEAGDELEMATDDDASDEESDDDDDANTHPVTYREDTEAQRDRTLFIRNLSFQSSEEGLRDFFTKFGAVEYARVVIDKGSGLSKGVGFVRFRQREVADQVLARAEATAANAAALDSKKDKKKKKPKKPENVFALSAMADGDDTLTLDGRLLSITRAVSKTEADHLAEANAAQRKAQDKRNLYLAYEGTINVNKVSDEQLEMPASDIAKRRRALKEKKEKLKHPLYFVSPLRLSVRNLASSVDDKKLKEIGKDAAVTGMRAGKVARAEVKREFLPASDSVPVKVKMSKVVREDAGVSTRGAAKSRGYGFIEFAEHVHALAALRELNNNPRYTSLAAGKAAAPGASDSNKPRLIVEFALENHGKLKLREKRRQDAEKKREEERALREAAGTDGAETEKKEKKSRGQRQRERKKEREQAKQEAQDESTGRSKPVKAKSKPAVVTSKPVAEKKRKRESTDAELDRVASKVPVAASAKSLSRKERKKARVSEKEQERSFDELVRSYKQDLFGEIRKPAAGSTAGGDEGLSRERWFD